MVFIAFQEPTDPFLRRRYLSLLSMASQDPDAPPVDIASLATRPFPGLNLEHRKLAVSDTLYLDLFQAQGPASLRLENHFRNDRAHVGFNFCLEGRTSFALSGGYPTAHARADKVNNFLMPACDTTQGLVLEPGLSLVTLYIELGAFRKLLGEGAEAAPVRLLDAMEHGADCYFESYGWQAIIKTALSQIFHARMTPFAQRIYIESKALELVAVILDYYAHGAVKRSSLSRADVERIHHAKELLLRDLANPPSLSKLARAAGTNEFTLKLGFKQVFDMPVFKYLQQTRLAKAYDLFQSTNLQVSEVANLVGYESVSSFTRAFQAQYGLRPGEVKRIPFRTI